MLCNYKEKKGEGGGFGSWQFEFMMCERMSGVRVVCETLKCSIFKVWNKGKKTDVVIENIEEKFRAFL